MAKHPGGRPTSYKPDYARQARVVCALLGAIDTDLAELFNVDRSTIYDWKNKSPEFADALKQGKAELDAKVEKSLYERASGYEAPEDKVIFQDGEPQVMQITKRYPPDATSMIFWLKNRQPERWRDKREIDAHVKQETLTPITVDELESRIRADDDAEQ